MRWGTPPALFWSHFCALSSICGRGNEVCAGTSHSRVIRPPQSINSRGLSPWGWAWEPRRKQERAGTISSPQTRAAMHHPPLGEEPASAPKQRQFNTMLQSPAHWRTARHGGPFCFRTHGLCPHPPAPLWGRCPKQHPEGICTCVSQRRWFFVQIGSGWTLKGPAPSSVGDAAVSWHLRWSHLCMAS